MPPVTNMPDILSTLESLAKAATPELREWSKMALSVRVGEYVPVSVYEDGTQGNGNARDEHNAAILYIRQFNPATILKLCAAVREMEGALRFYANPDSYTDDHGEPVAVPDFYDELCFGERAEAALREAGK